LALRHSSGAYYLAGYAVEFGLKAAIAKATARHEFPDKVRANESWKHDLASLVKTANLDLTRQDASRKDPIFSANWDLVARWNEQSRYSEKEYIAAKALIDAISQRQHGVMVWLIRHW
jgi:hypothetical protein